MITFKNCSMTKFILGRKGEIIIINCVIIIIIICQLCRNLLLILQNFRETTDLKIIIDGMPHQGAVLQEI